MTNIFIRPELAKFEKSPVQSYLLMNWTHLERAFTRALLLSISKKKLFFAFPVLVLCGILSVFCKAVAFEASPWVSMSFAFLPILVSSGLLLALGVLLIRLHDAEVKRMVFDFKRWIGTSIDLVVGTSYLAFLPILSYLFLWMLLGVFFLLKEIPLLGDFFSIVFSFGPFLLIFGSLLLCLSNLVLLFFVAPAAALQSVVRIPLAKRVWNVVNQKFLTSLLLFLIAMIPIGLVSGLLYLAAALTDSHFLVAEQSLSVALEWFFIMIPFAAILTPAVIFFFNFAAESFLLLQGGAPIPSFYGTKARETSETPS